MGKYTINKSDYWTVSGPRMWSLLIVFTCAKKDKRVTVPRWIYGPTELLSYTYHGAILKIVFKLNYKFWNCIFQIEVFESEFFCYIQKISREKWQYDFFLPLNLLRCKKVYNFSTLSMIPRGFFWPNSLLYNSS